MFPRFLLGINAETKKGTAKRRYPARAPRVGAPQKGGGMDMPIVIIGSCVVAAACFIALWLMP